MYKYCLLFLLLFGCGPDHTQNVETSPPAMGGAPQNSFNLNGCIYGQKVTCEYSYTTNPSTSNISITYGYRVCINNVYGECLKN